VLALANPIPSRWREPNSISRGTPFESMDQVLRGVHPALHGGLSREARRSALCCLDLSALRLLHCS
jgi:hypothetical protein